MQFNIFHFIKYLFKKLKEKDKIYYKGIYAVTGGTYLGSFFVFMNIDKDEKIIIDRIYDILNFPDNKIIRINGSIINDGIKNKILELVGILPKDVYIECQNQYNYHKKKEKNESNS